MDDPASITTTLLQRLQGEESAAWAQLVRLFTPTLERWCRAKGIAGDDLEDVVQEVFLQVARSIPTFRREKPGDTFGGWLRRITRNRCVDHLRRKGRAPAEAAEAELSLLPAKEQGFSAEEVAEIYRLAADQVRPEFAPRVFRAFELTALERVPSKDVATELGMTRAAVYRAKHRVYSRIRAELSGLA